MELIIQFSVTARFMEIGRSGLVEEFIYSVGLVTLQTFPTALYGEILLLEEVAIKFMRIQVQY